MPIESDDVAIRVATYRRISTDETNQPYSLGAQQQRLTDFANSQAGYELTHDYEDQKSGATLERPGLQAALRAAENGEFDILLVYRIDRLARSSLGLSTIVQRLESAGVGLRSATEPIDSSGPIGKMITQLLGIFAELERGILIDRVIAGNERKASRGEVLGRPPLGYRRDPATKALVVDDAQAALVRQIFKMYAEEEMGTPAIAQRLNETGRRGRSGGRWSATTVLKLLDNPIYIGRSRHRGTTYPGLHEAIVDVEMFEQAQLIRERRSKSPAARAGNKSDYVLTGLLWCSMCGAAYVGASAHGRSERYRYYVCDTKQKYGTRQCAGDRVDADGLERGIRDLIESTYADLDLFAAAALEAAADAPEEVSRLTAEIDGLDVELADVRRRRGRYLEAFESGDLKADHVGDRLVEIETRGSELEIFREALIAQRRDLEVGIPNRTILEGVRAEISAVLAGGTPPILKQLYSALIEKVVIAPGRIAHPELRVPAAELHLRAVGAEDVSAVRMPTPSVHRYWPAKHALAQRLSSGSW